MQLKRRVALNGVWLDEVDSRIAVSGIEPGDGKENISAADTAGAYGQRVTGNRRTFVDLVVKFRMLERGRSVNGMTERAELLEKVNEWAAGGGWLTLNYKPGRRIGVILAQAPGEGSLWDFSKEFQMTFRAYTVPYWEDTEMQTLRIQNTNSVTRAVGIPGSARTPLQVEFKNTSGNSIGTFSIAAGGKTVSFSSLALANNETLIIDTDSGGLFRARILNTSSVYRSVLDKRSSGSSDDLVIPPGATSVTMTAQYAGTLTIGYRGRYL